MSVQLTQQKDVTWGDETIGLGSDSEDWCNRWANGIIDPTDLDGRDQRSSERRPQITKIQRSSGSWLRSDDHIHTDGALYFGKRICAPQGEIRQKVLTEAHSSVYSIHLGGTKCIRSETTLLVECNEERNRTIRVKMFSVSAGEGRTPDISQTSSTITNSRVEVGAYHHRFCHSINPRPKETMHYG